MFYDAYNFLRLKMRISYTSLETYIQCPQKFKFKEIDRIKTLTSKEAFFGTVIHGTLKFLHNNSLIVPTLDNVLNHYKNVWNPDVFTDPQEEEIYFKQGTIILTNYYNSTNVKATNVVDLETPFKVDFQNYTLAGKIDRIDRTGENQYEIVDYKTSKKLPSQESVDNNLQLSLYRLGITNRWPNLKFDQVTLSLYFLKHGVKISTVRTEDQLEATKIKVSNIIADIEAKKFQPVPSPLCDYCGYRNICPIWRHELVKNELGVKDQEQLNNILKEFFELKNAIQKDSQRLEELKAIIGEYCDQNKIERVFGEEGYITRTVQRRYTYDSEKIKSVLGPLGRWEEVLRVDDTKLKTLLASLSLSAQEQIKGAKIVDKEFRTLTATKKKAKKAAA